MRLKVVVVDLELSPRAKRHLIRMGAPLAIVLGGGALAYAGGWTVPNQWGPGTPAGSTLTAAALNENFAALADAGAALDQRVSLLATAPMFGTFPTEMNPQSGEDVSHPSGTTTITLTTAGTYKVTLSSAAYHGNAPFTQVLVAWDVGGSATRLDPLESCTMSSPGSPQSSDGAYSCVTVFQATAGQTITLLPHYNVSYTSGTHTFSFSYLVERIGN